MAAKPPRRISIRKQPGRGTTYMASAALMRKVAILEEQVARLTEQMGQQQAYTNELIIALMQMFAATRNTARQSAHKSGKLNVNDFLAFMEALRNAMLVPATTKDGYIFPPPDTMMEEAAVNVASVVDNAPEFDVTPVEPGDRQELVALRFLRASYADGQRIWVDGRPVQVATAEEGYTPPTQMYRRTPDGGLEEDEDWIEADDEPGHAPT